MATSAPPDRRPLIRTLTLPADANLHGGIFGGWILAELDKAAGLVAMARAKGGAVTVGIENLRFVSALGVGEDFTIYGDVARVGRTSMHLRLEGWASDPAGAPARLVVEGTFISVAVDAAGKPRAVPPSPGP